MFSVELIPDAATDAAVRAEWGRLIEAGLPSAGRHEGESNRPHVTLAVREALDPAALAPISALLPVPLELGGTLVFGREGRFVLARAVVMTRKLLDLHRAVAFAAGAAGPRYGNTMPDRWSPHVTLARRLDADGLAHALSVLELRAVDGAAVGLRVWDAGNKRVTTLR
ncbi:2'-5' RNA ligase family protein [Microbacterium timonense]|uniref:2'-5' RNA ligase family protein n=1 Tax=Microbacterium timonense TaxID=2086576 RepID=UPI000D10DB26|nr:2'-5' RNA ligase family protein [Microbacterium timonense]